MINQAEAQLSEELLDRYLAAALGNAQALLEEAEILVSRERFARGYFLAVSSIEETGKAGLAFGAKGRNLGNGAVQKKLRDIFEDHSQKIGAAFLGWLHSSVSVRDSVQAAVELIVHLKRGREPSMYIDVKDDGSISVPASMVRPVAAKDCVEVARNCLAHMRTYVSSTVPRRTSTFDDKFLCIRASKVSEIFKLDDFGKYLLDCLETKKSEFNWIEAVVTYHDAYYCKRVLYTARAANNALQGDAGNPRA